MKLNQSIRIKRRRTPLFPPGNSPDAPEPVVCTLFERCKGCPYPGHGFICWGKDGSCLRTIMEKVYERKEPESNVLCDTGDSNLIKNNTEINAGSGARIYLCVVVISGARCRKGEAESVTEKVQISECFQTYFD